MDARERVTARTGSNMSRRRILVLYWYPRELEMRLAVRQHLYALDELGTDEVIYHNAEDGPPRWLRWSKPDLIVLHTIFLGMRWYVYANDFHRDYLWLADIDCPKIALPQDEYDHSEVLEEWLADHGATHVFSCFGPELREILYPHLSPQVEFRETLTGFIDTAAAAAIADKITPCADRPFDIVYRAAQLPYWFGSHGQLKHELGKIVADRAPALGLTTDISTRYEDTVFGAQWLDFIMSGRGIIGCESGSSVLDRRGAIQEQIRAMLADEPDLSFAEVDARMPRGWDSYAFFAISPRHLEAVVTKTCQVLVEGSYSGVLEPNRHYIPVRRDLEDLDDALLRLRDEALVTGMVETAYEEIYLSGRYTTATFAADLVAAVGTRRVIRRPIPVPVLRGAGRAFDTAAAAPGRARRATRSSLGRGRRKLETKSARWPVAGRVVPWLIRPRLPTLRPPLYYTVVVVNIALVITEAATLNPYVRELLVRAYRAGARPSLRLLARDLLRIGIIGRVRRDQGTAAVPWWIAADVEGDAIVLRSETGRYERPRADLPETAALIRRLSWDHAEVGPHVLLAPKRPRAGSIAVGAGASGHYDFATIPELAARFDVSIVDLVQWSRGGLRTPVSRRRR